jgi:nucleoside-diphosphate-sugar epimerase
MRVLVTGGAGYIGSTLVPMLLERGYDVRVVDSGLFGVEHLPTEAEVVLGDVLDFQEEWLEGVEAVIHLAALSNDPMADFSPRLNYQVNAAGAALVAQMCRRRGIQRFVMGSTCSVYGFTEQEVDEEWDARPSYPYAISKLMAERALQCLEGDGFHPIILRKGTVIGWSPRMRYDLVANTMVKTALTEGRIVVRNPRLWRPILDVRDAAAAYVCALEASAEVTGVFNVALGNYTVAQIAQEVAEVLAERGISVTIEHQNLPDVRNYRVSTRKAREVLGFQPSISLKDSVRNMLDKIQAGINADFENPRYYNIEWWRRVVEGGLPYKA